MVVSVYLRCRYIDVVLGVGEGMLNLKVLVSSDFLLLVSYGGNVL
jgi:hypothetical protein